MPSGWGKKIKGKNGSYTNQHLAYGVQSNKWRKKKEGTRRLARKGKRAYRKASDIYKVYKAGKYTVKKGLKNSPQVALKYMKTGAMTYPGSRYIGPGNKLDMGRPKTYGDHLAYIHDHQYDELLKKGANPYGTFNRADRQLLKKADPRKKDQAPVYWGMQLKKLFQKKNMKHKVSTPAPYHVKYASSPKNTYTKGYKKTWK